MPIKQSFDMTKWQTAMKLQAFKGLTGHIGAASSFIDAKPRPLILEGASAPCLARRFLGREFSTVSRKNRSRRRLKS